MHTNTSLVTWGGCGLPASLSPRPADKELLSAKRSKDRGVATISLFGATVCTELTHPGELREHSAQAYCPHVTVARRMMRSKAAKVTSASYLLVGIVRWPRRRSERAQRRASTQQSRPGIQGRGEA